MLRPILVDSDGGVDDAVALWYACTAPDLELLAVTAVAGNVTVEQAAANVATVLAAAGREDVPVAVGAADPLGPVPPATRPAAAHGGDGLGDTGTERLAFSPSPLPADELLLRLVGERPGEVTVVAIGPMTNLARAQRLDAGFAEQVHRLVAMGGSVRAGGNATPAAETNVARDPAAAAEVVAARWRRPPLLVGLDVTYQATLSPTELAVLAARANPAAAFCDGPVRAYQQRGSLLVPDGSCPCHDLVAIMAAADPTLLEGPVVDIAVDTNGGPAWGATVADLRQPLLASRGFEGGRTGTPWQVALEADVARFRLGVRQLFGD